MHKRVWVRGDQRGSVWVWLKSLEGKAGGTWVSLGILMNTIYTWWLWICRDESLEFWRPITKGS